MKIEVRVVSLEEYRKRFPRPKPETWFIVVPDYDNLLIGPFASWGVANEYAIATDISNYTLTQARSPEDAQ